MKTLKIASLALASASLMLCSCAKTENTANAAEEEINDTNTPLHELKPDYKTPYGELTVEQVQKDMDRVFHYIDSVTPAKVLDADGNEITDLANLPSGAKLNPGTFRLTSYEWGVTYQALLDAAEILNDPKYKDYVTTRFKLLNDATPGFLALKEKGETDRQMRQVITPANLDDAGAMGAAAMAAQMADSTLQLSEMIERYYNILENNSSRLPDGMLVRQRPLHNAVWLDDMFMAVPTMAIRGKYANDPKAIEDAAKLTTQFIDRMWVPEKKLFRHGYVEGLEQEPTFHWARANGWAILTMCRILDVLPQSSPYYKRILTTLQDHIKGLTDLQSADGFWHQLLDRNDSYLETSATAIYAYCIAHAINQGWVTPETYGPVAHLAWEAVATQINDKGEVEGTCVGTGMGFDTAFYYYRPVSSKAAHGYGPTLWAGAEMIKLIKNFYPTYNDAAIHYYTVDPEAKTTIFTIDENGKASEVLH